MARCAVSRPRRCSGGEPTKVRTLRHQRRSTRRTRHPTVPSALTTVTYGALLIALAALWAPRVLPASPRVARIWTFPFAVAVVAALAARIIDVRAVLVLLLWAVACRAASRAVTP